MLETVVVSVLVSLAVSTWSAWRHFHKVDRYMVSITEKMAELVAAMKGRLS